MKLEPHTYKSWWDLHAWAGVLISLITYVMFFFGTITLFHRELAIWQEPPRGPVPTNDEVDRIIDTAIAQKKVSPQRMRINFSRPGSAGFDISYSDPQGVSHGASIQRAGLVEPRSKMADFFYGMHYLQFPSAPPWLYTVAGLASGLLLLVLVSGLLIHLRDVVAQFHRFRPRKRLQVVWSDAHKVLGTIGLPFAAVYAFTGAWMGLDSVMGPRLAKAGFRGDEAALSRALNGPPEVEVAPANLPAPRLSLARLRALAKAAPRSPGSKPKRDGDCRSVFLNNVGDREGTALFYCADDSVVFRQRDGGLVAGAASTPPPLMRRIAEVPNSMHFVEFAELPLRLLYALLAICGAAAILTGNWLWLARRVPTRSTWLLQRSTLMVGTGPLVASAVMLLVNRFGISATFEERAFWWSWLAVAVASVLGGDAAAHWRRLIGLAGAICALAPLVGLATYDHAYDAWRNVRVERSVDAGLFALGLSLLWVSRNLGQWSRQQHGPAPATSPDGGAASVV